MLSAEQKRLLAQRVSQRRPAAASTIPRRSQNLPTAPLSYAQQRFWFLSQLADGNAAYSVAEYHRLTGPLDTAALERSVNEILNRHSALRTTFAVQEGVPVQRISPVLHLSLPVEDLSHVPAADQRAALWQLVMDEARRPWSLEHGPLVRARLWRLGDAAHQLLIVMHHIVSDGWSQGVLIRELAALYEAFSNGRPSPLPELPIEYADFAAWQHDWMRTPQFDQQLSYWKEAMRDPPVLQLARLGPAGRDGSGTHKWFRLSAEVTAGVRELAQREGATVFMVMLAAFSALLSRYSGQTDVVVGSPVANRDRPELEPLIGSFMNPLPIRVDLSGNPTFRELIGRVRRSALGAFANQNVPFDVLVRTLHARRDPANSPLFQAMFLMQNTGLHALQLSGAGIAAKSYASLNTTLPDDAEMPGDLLYPLALQILEIGAVMGGTVEYGPAHAAFMKRFPDHLRTLLCAAMARPDTRIGHLSVLPANERSQLLVAWNHEQRREPLVPVHQLIESQAAVHPDTTAVVAGRASLTYAELNVRANTIARALRARRVGPETRVGILIDRSVDMVAAVLGVMKSGGAYVPLDAAYPAERLRYIARNAGLQVVITSGAVAERLPDLAGRDEPSFSVIMLDDLPASDGGGNVDGGATSEHLAYVIYTSGSTGVPKGTMVTHGSLANAFRQWDRTYQLRGLRAHLQMASLSFDVCTGDIVRALGSGATLVIAAQEDLFSPAALCTLMQQHHVDAAEFVPVVLRDLVKYVERTATRLPDLKLLVAGSDGWFTGEYAAISRLFGDRCRLVNSYGLTEATIDSTYFDGPVEDGAEEALVPLGRAFANTELLVLDRHLQLVPIAIPGELCVAGVALSRGYLDRPDLTAERFVPHPFSDVPGARLYRTGDLARYRPDGTLELLGRIDNQVKLRGFRIELSEVESVLRAQEGVLEAVAMVREDEPGDRRLVAYVVLAGDTQSVSALRAQLRATVPDYMVPAAIVTLPAMPLTPNGKIDRAALPKPDGARQLDQAFVSPRTAVERQLAAIWCDVLRVERVGVTDNFFDLGGHSLLLIQLHARIVAALPVRLTVLDLFRFPTIVALAGHLANHSAETVAAVSAQHRADRRRAVTQRRKRNPARVLRDSA